jgi:hypothetical protein
MIANKTFRLRAVGFALCSSPGVAFAQSSGRAVVVVVEGGASDAVKSQIAAHIQPPHAVADGQPFLAALAAHGTRALAPAIGNPALDARLIAHARAAAGETHADIVILMAHRTVRRVAKSHLWVIDTRTTDAPVDEDLPTGTATDEANAAWMACEGLLPPPPKEAPSKEPAPKETAFKAAAADGASAVRGRTEEPKPAAVPSDQAQPLLANAQGEHPTRRTALLVVQGSIDGASRHVSYVDRLTANLRSYDLFAAPMVSISAEGYPLVRRQLPWMIAGLGVTGDYARAFALASADVNGTHVGTRWQAFDLGLRERIVIHTAMDLGVNVGFGAIDFQFDPPPFSATLPDVGYRFLRAAVDFRATRGELAVFASGGYLGVLSAGKMGSLFPRERVAGIEARAGAAYGVAGGFELSLGLGYTRFFYSMHPQPGDANVAGGALDEMARLSLNLAYLL